LTRGDGSCCGALPTLAGDGAEAGEVVRAVAQTGVQASPSAPAISKKIL
jgi:hypothetical protein